MEQEWGKGNKDQTIVNLKVKWDGLRLEQNWKEQILGVTKWNLRIKRSRQPEMEPGKK